MGFEDGDSQDQTIRMISESSQNPFSKGDNSSSLISDDRDKSQAETKKTVKFVDESIIELDASANMD